jgi:glutathione S-transferase
MLKIWGRLSSINVQKVVWTCDELGLEYERTDAGGTFGINNTPEYLAKNPNGLVPVIEEDGFVLYESNAIVRYLAAKYGGGKLWPADARARADADRWMEWQATGFTPAMWAAFWQLVRTAPEKRDAAAVQASVSKTKKLAGILDAHLRDREHLAANMFTPADIVVGCAAHRWLNMPVERDSLPNLERWYASLRSRPGSRQVTSSPVT